MADTQTRPMPDNESPVDPAVWEEEVRAMRELLARLPPPPSIEEIARTQGVRLPQRVEELILEWPEGEWDDDEDFDVWQAQQRAPQLKLQEERYAQLFPDNVKP